MSLRHTLVPTACLIILAGGVMMMLRVPAQSTTPEAAPSIDLTGVEQEHEVLSKTYEVDRKYRSMMGPWSQQKIYLVEADEPELLWIIGYRAVMVGEDGEKPMPQEFMCHSNLDINPGLHRQHFKGRKNISGRLFTLSQGQFEIDMPPGFGIPIMSNEALNLTTQVLNLNHDDQTFQVRHKVTLNFVRHKDLKKPLVPLFPSGIYGLASLEGRPLHFGVQETSTSATSTDHGDHSDHSDHGDHSDQEMAEISGVGPGGPGCMVGQNAAEHEYKDSLGRRFTGHWVVEPGREVNRTLVTKIMNLPFDTTAHYIAVHLHPFAESLELIDETTGETVFKSHVRPAQEGVGIDHVEYFSDPGGVKLFKDHEYSLESVYNNTSGEPQDSMAVMYMYLYDPEFKKPEKFVPQPRALKRKAPGS